MVNITVLCTLSLPLNAVTTAIKLGLRINKIIGLAPNSIKNKDKVSGYIDIAEYCKSYDIEPAYVNDYTLKSEKPEQLLKNTDILWVCGWQRLIPHSFLSYPGVSIFGAHGSVDGIQLGRGRSPHNWALIMGAHEFEISLFEICEGIDSGDVYFSKKIRINESDDIAKLHENTSIAVGQLFTRLINLDISAKGLSQTGESAYFPRRTPNDGSIDWNLPAKVIYNQIRALGLPYPCARSYFDGEEILISKGTVISSQTNSAPGTILHVFENGSLLVSAMDETLCIETISQIDKQKLVRKQFESIHMQDTLSDILFRFSNEFPSKKLNPSLVKFWSDLGMEVPTNFR